MSNEIAVTFNDEHGTPESIRFTDDSGGTSRTVFFEDLSEKQRLKVGDLDCWYYGRLAELEEEYRAAVAAAEEEHYAEIQVLLTGASCDKK